jgi:butyrate kinase
MANGRSVASTMGFTALDGLVMGTRSGTIDPGVMIWLMDEMGMGPRELERLLYHRSGLLGVSGVSSDMRTLLASDEPRAKLAIELFCYRAGRELGSLAAALGGLDALVSTRRRSVRPSFAAPPGSDSRSTRTRTPRASGGSRRTRRACPRTSCRPTRSS